MSRMRIDQVEIRDADIFEILLDSFPDMIHSVDQQGNIVYTNKRAESLLGYTKQELVNMNIRQIYSDDVLESLEKGFTDLKERGDKSVESMLKAKNGEEIPVEIRSFSIYDDEGNFLRTFSILRDIREIKELQNSLVHAGRLAAIGEMASGVAHDINNPLTVIVLSNEMMLREIAAIEGKAGVSMERLKNHAQDVQKATNSIRKLADHLRNFSRGMAEKYEPLDLFDSIVDSLFITHSKIQSSMVTAQNNAKKGRCFTRGLPNQIEQVFVNLISNACDAMVGRSTRQITISVSAAAFDGVDCWRCDITDTGNGIPRDLQEEVFQSFFTTKEKGKGTGLGLSISRGIVRDHKGDIELTSEPGVGSTFSVLLPKIDPPDER
jgi:PAS domain S-box-containing protein